MNVTPQRIAIYRALLEATDHPSPEAISARVRPTMPSLSLATIYKTLEAPARLGLVSELSTTGKARRYDGNRDQHHHLVCTRCTRVTDYYDPALDRVPRPDRQRPHPRALRGLRGRRGTAALLTSPDTTEVVMAVRGRSGRSHPLTSSGTAWRGRELPRRGVYASSLLDGRIWSEYRAVRSASLHSGVR